MKNFSIPYMYIPKFRSPLAKVKSAQSATYYGSSTRRANLLRFPLPLAYPTGFLLGEGRL